MSDVKGGAADSWGYGTPDGLPPVKAGDSVRHRPSGETWTVAAVSDDGLEVACAGWPETIAYVTDCDIIERCSEEAREKMIASCAGLTGVRGSWTRELLRVREECRQRDVAKTLTFAQLRTVNLARVAAFGHGGLEAWDALRWALAMAGEVGEVLNEAKKCWRGDGDVRRLADELADVVIYHDLLAARIGIAAEIIVKRCPALASFRDLEANFRVIGLFSHDNERMCSLATLLRYAGSVVDDSNPELDVGTVGPYAVLSGMVPIGVQWVASAWNIDLDAAVVRKFNATSDARKIGVRL